MRTIATLLLLLIPLAVAAEEGVTPAPAERPPTLLELGAKAAVQGLLSFMFESRAEAADLRIDAEAGEVLIKNLRIANPKGFGEGPAIEVGEAAIKAQADLLFSDSPTVHSVQLRGVKLNAAHDLKRGLNLKKLVDSASRIKQPDWQDETVPLRIEEVRIDASEVRLESDLLLAGPRTWQLDAMRFDNAQLGGGSGATAEEAIVTVLEKITALVAMDTVPGLE